MMRRSEPYAEEHAKSSKGADRVNYRPKTLTALLRWATRQYEMESPGNSKTSKMHTGTRLEVDGDPAMTGETQSWLGMTYPRDGQRQDQPTDWREVACRVDRETGYYVTPLRCAIARVGDPDRRQLLGGLAVNLFTPLDVTRSMSVPDWCAGDVMWRALELLWNVYQDKPLPQASRKSDAQLDAEAA